MSQSPRRGKVPLLSELWPRHQGQVPLASCLLTFDPVNFLHGELLIIRQVLFVSTVSTSTIVEDRCGVKHQYALDYPRRLIGHFVFASVFC